MRDYVLERAAHYRDKLGIVASVHRDFQNLSDQLRDQTTNPKLERIILYIDDLDRCPPERVVEMLQAIHLLLSFELFVVVVAVDPTWLLRSLDAYYARQFPSRGHRPAEDRESQPQFYLEKIFQIPYALQPMDPTRFGTMVSSLLTSAVVAAAESSRPPSSASAAEAAPAGPHAGPGSPPAPRPSPPGPTPASPRVASGLELNPRNLEINQDELDHLRELGPLVSSPRGAKRLTNLYRIVRAGLDGDALDEFIDGRYQLTQLMLAAVVGCPDVFTGWLGDLLSRPACTPTELLQPLAARAASSPRAKFLADRLRGCAELADWPHVVAVCRLAARYSFETGALLQLQPA
jgi:hypothetical protein